MAFKVPFIPTKRHLEDADGIDSFTLFETERVKVIGKGAFASAVLAKHDGEEVVLKEMLCKHWDVKRKNIKKVCYSPFVIMMHYSNLFLLP